MTIHIDLSTRRCSECDRRKPAKGGQMRAGKFICAECAQTLSVRLSKPKKNHGDSRIALREKMKNEVAEAKSKREQIAAGEAEREIEGLERQDKRLSDQLEKAMKMVNGDEFRAWYEATTGEDVAEFIQRLNNPRSFQIGKPGSGWRRQMCERIAIYVQNVADRNPWKNPENRLSLVKELADVRDSKERRRIMLRLATPAWADQESVIAIYRERNRISIETGIPHEVDHIVPIVSHVVCGLHCEHNLRVIPTSENRSKSNSHFV